MPDDTDVAIVAIRECQRLFMSHAPEIEAALQRWRQSVSLRGDAKIDVAPLLYEMFDLGFQNGMVYGATLDHETLMPATKGN